MVQRHTYTPAQKAWLITHKTLPTFAPKHGALRKKITTDFNERWQLQLRESQVISAMIRLHRAEVAKKAATQEKRASKAAITRARKKNLARARRKLAEKRARQSVGSKESASRVSSRDSTPKYTVLIEGKLVWEGDHDPRPIEVLLSTKVASLS